MTDTMRAYVIKEPGGPERLELREIPRPTLRNGWALIRIRAFGLNRSEWFTRRGESPSVKFPRVLGIECVGEVVAAPGCNLSVGQRVAAMMGGIGRQFDGSYAEYVLAPQQNVFPLQTHLDWNLLGALPEMLQTSHYHDYASAQRLDEATCEAIEALRYEALDHESACGRVPLSGLLLLARRRGLHISTLDLRNSGDTAGGRDRVVGYGSWSLA